MENRAEACWPYVRTDGPGAPVLGLMVEGPQKSFPKEGEAQIRIDTGYDGFLLLSEEDYKHLGLNLAELPRKYWPEGETVMGEVFRLRRALTIVHVPRADMKLQGYVDTFRGNTENLVGLGFIKDLRLLLEGPTQRVCII